MRHLKNEPFYSFLDEPFMVNDRTDEGAIISHPATVPEALRLVVQRYQSQPGKQLDFGGLESLGHSIRTLRGEPDASGYYSFEREDWKVLVQVFDWIAPQIEWSLSTPALKKALNDAPENLSPAKGNKANGKLEEVKA